MLDTTTPTLPPPPPSIAALTIPERMIAVMRRRRMQGEPTTRADFRQAEETCDLTDGELDSHIGAAKRLIHPEVVREDGPAAPVDPWDFDPDYRRERVAAAARRLAGLLPSEADMIAQLRAGDLYSARELGALWPEIMRALGAASLFQAVECARRTDAAQRTFDAFSGREG